MPQTPDQIRNQGSFRSVVIAGVAAVLCFFYALFARDPGGAIFLGVVCLVGVLASLNALGRTARPPARPMPATSEELQRQAERVRLQELRALELRTALEIEQTRAQLDALSRAQPPPAAALCPRCQSARGEAFCAKCGHPLK